MIARSVCFVLALLLCGAAAAQQQSDPWQPVARALGRAGEEQDGVYRVAFPRNDLRVRVGGVEVRAGLVLTSWMGFQQVGPGTMVMGDLVLLAREVPPVIAKLVEAGVEVTAVHNHLLNEEPRVMYVHFHGHGEAAELATSLRSALALTATPLEAPRPGAAQEEGGLDVEQLSQILGHRGRARGGVVNFGIPRAEKITGGGASLGPRMGLATAINFQAAGGEAAIAGDFVLLAKEVQPVIRALGKHGIEVTAVHNHMLDEQPRLFFLHFWGRAGAERLARGLRAALEETNHVKP